MNRPIHDDLSSWGLRRAANGDVTLHGRRLHDLARSWGTPLHLVNRTRLAENARRFATAAHDYLGSVASVHYACKCNGVPGVLRELRQERLNIEVMSPYELRTARMVGYPPDSIIVNGPCKSVPFLREAISSGARLIVVDSLAEIDRLDMLARELGVVPRVLIRVNPDIRIRGLSRGSSTGRRKTCAFGLDLRSGEVEIALGMLRSMGIQFEGFHAHIGTGIRDPQAYRRLIGVMGGLIRRAERMGFSVHCLDLGGGFPSPSSREFTPLEMLGYQVFGRLPAAGLPPPPVQEYFDVIAEALRSSISENSLSSVILEPGRSIVSDAQMLLLSVEYVKSRPGTETWVITDGGLGTVTLPTYYEFHEIILCNDQCQKSPVPVTILGPGCFAGDVVARNKLLPPVTQGDVIAVMDSGAYFTAMESNFGYPRPAIVAVDPDGETLWRRRESFGDFVQRDVEHTPLSRSIQ